MDRYRTGSLMPADRRIFIQSAAALVGLVAIGGLATLRLWPSDAPFKGSLSIWRDRLRPHLGLASTASTHYPSRSEALAFLERELSRQEPDDTVEGWVVAFEKARSAQFGASQIIYLDGWPFAPVEVALLSLATESPPSAG
jgi:hypothetical protein